MNETEVNGGEAENAAQSAEPELLEAGNLRGTVSPVWARVNSVSAPSPVRTPREVDLHPFDAPSRWQVAGWGLAIAAILVLALIGLWQAASWGIVAMLFFAAVFRLTHRRTWTRARGRVFDVVALLLTAGALSAVLLFLPD